MSKASINKKYTINAKGILSIEDGVLSVENEETGELIALTTLFADFADKDVAISIAYNEDYE